MARPFKLNRKEFLEIYDKVDKTRDISFELDITMPTVYAYLKKFDLPTKKSRAHSDEFIESLFNEYRGLISIDDLCDKYKMIIGVIRYNLEKHVYKLWNLSKKKPDWPKPATIKLIKVYNELAANPKLANDVKLLSAIVNVPVINIERYLSSDEKKIVSKKKKVGKRSKK